MTDLSGRVHVHLAGGRARRRGRPVSHQPADPQPPHRRGRDGGVVGIRASPARPTGRLASASGWAPAADRLLTWSPSTPALPAVFWGAMIAGAVLVPLDLRMSPAVLQRIAGRSGARFLALGTGADAPDPESAGLAHLDQLTLDDLTADPAQDDRVFPSNWEAVLDFVAPTHAGVAVRDRVHVRDDVAAQGRDAHPRQLPRHPRRVPGPGAATPPPDRFTAAPVAPVRAGAGAVLRHDVRRRGPVRPLEEPAGDLRGAPRAGSHDHGGHAPAAGDLLDRDRAGDRPPGPAQPVRARTPAVPPPPLPTPPASSSDRSTVSWAAS